MKKSTLYTISAALLIIIGIYWPSGIANSLFDIIVHIRFAIHTGDGGTLITDAMWLCVLFSIPNILIFMGLDLLRQHFKVLKSSWWRYMIFTFLFAALKIIPAIIFHQSIEILSAFLGVIFTLFLIHITHYVKHATLPHVIIAFQVFFLMEWLNVMPAFSRYHLGYSDISVSLKIASGYLDNVSTINAIGLSFVAVLTVSSLMTAIIFRLYVQNLAIVEENYANALAFESIQTKMMNNRVYQEINVLAHDLKTPLATVRGLSSLLVLTKDLKKLEDYGNRIDQAVIKMSDMISGFLYGSSRQWTEVEALINYVRSQIPLETDHIVLSFEMKEDLPPIYINKIRLARAIVNVISNAMIAPNTIEEKRIIIEAKAAAQSVLITIEDNGMGIAPADLDRIWTIGYSSNNTSGLGLPFAKQTVEENEGSITIDSKVGVGTIVTITIPIQPKETEHEKENTNH